MVPTRAGAVAVGDGLHDLLEPRRDGHVGIHLLASGRPLRIAVIRSFRACHRWNLPVLRAVSADRDPVGAQECAECSLLEDLVLRGPRHTLAGASRLSVGQGEERASVVVEVE